MPESHEYLPQNAAEVERLLATDRLIRDYFLEDAQFILEQLEDEEDITSFLYGQLLEIGEDPEEVLARYGVTETNNEV